MATWLYFATETQATEEDTRELAINAGCVWRSAYADRFPRQAIPHVRSVHPGHRIVLLYEDPDQRGSKVQGIFRVLEPGLDRIDEFPAIMELPVDDWYLESINYRRDPVLNRFVGFRVEVDACPGDESILETTNFRRSGRNAIEPYHELNEEPRPPVVLDDREEVTSYQYSSQLALHANWVVGKRFLGIDVGFSEINPSLGYCCLEVTGEGIEIDFENSGLRRFPEFRDTTLPHLLRAQEFSAVALDGPLTPEFHTSPRPWYRPQERLLISRQIPRRIKAQAYNSPVGRNLYHATMVLRFICQDHGYHYRPLGGLTARTDRLVLESFPKLWLALLLPPESISDAEAQLPVQRGLIDQAMARILFQAGRFQDSGLGISLAEAGIPVGIEKIAQFVNEDKDQACAFVSAMTALLLYMGWGVVLGNEGMGSFVLPAGALWHPGWHGKISGALNRFRVDEGGELELRELP